MEQLVELVERDKRDLVQLVRNFTELIVDLHCAIQEATEADPKTAMEATEHFRHRFYDLRGMDSAVSLCAVHFDGKNQTETRVVPILKQEKINDIRRRRAMFGQSLFLDRQYISTKAQPMAWP